jgi:hypothetical protein
LASEERSMMPGLFVFALEAHLNGSPKFALAAWKPSAKSRKIWPIAVAFLIGYAARKHFLVGEFGSGGVHCLTLQTSDTGALSYGLRTS